MSKIGDWWSSISKGAKIAICAGGVAVLATAITLPIVLTQKKSGGDSKTEYELVDQSGGFTTEEKIDVKKDIKYTFKVTFKTDPQPLKSFSVSTYDEVAGEEKYAIMTYGEMTGIDGHDWKLASGGYSITGTEITGTGLANKTIKFIAKFDNNYSQYQPVLLAGGA